MRHKIRDTRNMLRSLSFFWGVLDTLLHFFLHILLLVLARQFFYSLNFQFLAKGFPFWIISLKRYKIQLSNKDDSLQFCLVGKITIGKKFTLIFQSFVLAVKNSYQKIPSIPVRLYNETFYKFSCHFFCNQTSEYRCRVPRLILVQK